jgi:hypothetical protein
MVLIEDIEELWKFIFKLLNDGWKETDTVETMHEFEDYGKIRGYVKRENYTHEFGDEVFS